MLLVACANEKPAPRGTLAETDGPTRPVDDASAAGPPTEGGSVDAGPAGAGTADGGAAGGRASDGSGGPLPGQGCDDFGGAPTSTAPPIAGNWTLTFEDHFIGDVLDDGKWKVGEHWAGINGAGGNSPANIAVDCGYLTFTAEKRNVSFGPKSYAYATGELSTFKRFRQTYGYFEARLKYDGIQGLWPAFWMMPDRGNYGSGDNHRISYLKFDLAGDSRATVSSATLNLKVESVGSGTQNVMLFRVPDDSWKEGSMTWGNRARKDPLWIEQKYNEQYKAGDTVSFDVTDYVNQQLAHDKVISFALADNVLRGARVSFSSKEGSKAPWLELSGSPATVEVTEDTWVGEGKYAGANHGQATVLDVLEDSTSSCSTDDGGMEFDIMESLGTWGPHVTHHSMHWNGYGADHQKHPSSHVELVATGDGFHVYGLHWQKGLAEFYVDGKKTFAWSSSDIASVSEYIILSLQLGGWSDSYGNNGKVDDGALPGKMTVDYVRVWQGKP